MKVIQFEKKRTPREQEVQDDIVGILESELARAKRGDYAGIAIAAVNHKGAACTVSSISDQGVALNGALFHLMYRIESDLQNEPVLPEPEEMSHEDNQAENHVEIHPETSQEGSGVSESDGD